MQWVKPCPCPFRFKYYVFYTKNTKKVMPLISSAAFWKKAREESKKVPHTVMHHMIWKKNGLPGSCAVFVPQKNITLHIPVDLAGKSKSRNFLQTSRKTLLQWQYNLLPSYVPLNFWSSVKKTLCRHISEFETTSNSLILDKLTIVM